MRVHQIWIGTMPAREAAWVERVREAAEAAGHEYKLWREAELAAAFGEEPMWGWFARARTCMDNVTTWTLMSDYYGYRILAAEPGVHLDCDFELRGEWPELPEDKVYGISESYRRELLAYGIFMSTEARPFELAMRLAEEHLMRAADAGSERFEEQYIELVRGDKGRESGLSDAGIGPGWLRRVVLPAWAAEGIEWGFFEPHVVGHAKWPEAPLLAHVGTGGWLHSGRSRDAVYWQAMANRAQMRRERAEQYARQAATTAALRPQVRTILPQPSVRRTIPRPRRRPITLPRDTRRVLIFSNVRRGFPQVELQPGDCCIHLNRAVHRAELGDTPGVSHLLLIRSNGRGKWFAPSRLEGYKAVIPAEVSTLTAGMRWVGSWRSLSSASPTTGLLAASTIRESYPRLPLLLVGFDPAHSHGTPRSPIHDWHAEALYYTRNSFHLLPPT